MQLNKLDYYGHHNCNHFILWNKCILQNTFGKALNNLVIYIPTPKTCKQFKKDKKRWRNWALAQNNSMTWNINVSPGTKPPFWELILVSRILNGFNNISISLERLPTGFNVPDLTPSLLVTH